MSIVRVNNKFQCQTFSRNKKVFRVKFNILLNIPNRVECYNGRREGGYTFKVHMPANEKNNVSHDVHNSERCFKNITNNSGRDVMAFLADCWNHF